MIGRRGFITGLVVVIAIVAMIGATGVVLMVLKGPSPRFVCRTDKPLILPPGFIDADRFEQLVLGHCGYIIGAGRDKTIVERR